MSSLTTIPDEMEEELEAALPTGTESLRSRAVRSSGWTLVNYICSTVFRLGSTMVLTRLLLPQVYGLNTIIWIFIMGLHMFSDVGIGPSVIQNPRGDDPEFLNTAWTIQCIRGMTLFLCSMLIGYPVSLIYHTHSLCWLIPAAGTTAMLDGFVSTKYYTRSRHLSLAGTTVMDLGTSLLQIAVTLIWAWFSPTVVALIAGSIVGYGAKTVLTHVALPGMRNRFCWNAEAAKALVKFGRWIFVSTLLTFFGMQSDKLLFASRIPLEMLGIYGIACNLAGMPKEAILRIVGPITFSLYSRLGTSRESVASAFRRVRGPLLVLGAWAICGMIVTGPAIVHILYPKNYVAAGWLLQVLALSAWFEILETTNGSALLALGEARWIALANGAKLIAMVILVPLGFAFNGHHGLNGFYLALGGVVLAEVARFAVSAVGIVYERVGDAWRDLGVTAMFLATAAVGYLAEQHVPRFGSGRFSSLPAAVIAAAIVSLPWAPIAFMTLRTLRPGAARQEPVISGAIPAAA